MSAEEGRDSDQLDVLRTEQEHHPHHARGDVGGRYEHDEVEHLKAAERARQETSITEDAGPVLIVVMGVSGCGKSTLGSALAHAFGIPFVDADELHPQSNIDKMSAGIPLTDADRHPWLESVRAEAVRTVEEQTHSQSQQDGQGLRGVVVGCSALKRSYRDTLRGYSTDTPPTKLPTYFVHISGSREALLERMQNRKGHFMKAGMLDSQLDTLEPPGETGEPNVVTVELEQSVEEQIAQAKDGLRGLGLKV
ncbi:carbohydrate kinase [Fomitiporia mediterranea MF3/22]|uniref:carbohydrate kinase n=1 Tax=Fomitiporia mediterranea (strain MF3/22) TaxID=694068 RepID=UPI0004409C9C|nr:carbohydrate kinase [Fomitiporia mediterranea MF3/22]EJD05511.1 carbohydrate kinase [Fomitiporia mediterranea MF3/22]